MQSADPGLIPAVKRAEGNVSYGVKLQPNSFVTLAFARKDVLIWLQRPERYKISKDAET